MKTTETSPKILCKSDGPVSTVTIAHTRRRNALTTDMLTQFEEILVRLEADPRVRVVILTGAGDHFCAGMDIRALQSARVDGDELEYRMGAIEDLLAAFPKPTVASIRGYCVGGGMQLALACDLRISSTSAHFGVTPAKLGVNYPPRTVARLAHTLGAGTAKWLLFTADLVDAAAALRTGIVGEVTTPEVLSHRTKELAGGIAERSGTTISVAKQIVNAGDEIDLERWTLRENPDAAEGIAAFLEGRSPNFSGPR